MKKYDVYTKNNTIAQNIKERITDINNIHSIKKFTNHMTNNIIIVNDNIRIHTERKEQITNTHFIFIIFILVIKFII